MEQRKSQLATYMMVNTEDYVLLVVTLIIDNISIRTCQKLFSALQKTQY